MRGKCESCEAYQPEREWKDADQVKVYTLPGECRIRSVDDDGWPTREPDEWCLEHREREGETVLAPPG